MTAFTSPVPRPGSHEIPQISREIYGMPAFATLHTRALTDLVEWYVDGLGFIELFSIPGPYGAPVLVHLRRWHFQDLLIRPTTDAVVAGGAISLSFAAVVDELDGLWRRAKGLAGGAVTEPRDTAWNTRDVVATDPDGNVVVFTAARPPEAVDTEFSTRMAESSRDQGIRSGMAP